MAGPSDTAHARKMTSVLVLWHLMVVIVPLALAVIGTKIHRYGLALAEYKISFSLGDLFGVLGPDLIVLLLYTVGWGAILTLTPRYERWLSKQGETTLPSGGVRRFFLWMRERPIAAIFFVLVLTVFHFMSLLLLVLSVSEHGYFLIQRVPPDGYMLMYALDNFRMLEPVLASKMTTLTWSILAFVTGFFLFLPFILRRLAAARRRVGQLVPWSEWVKPGRYRKGLIAVVIWLALGLGTSAIGVTEELEGLQANGGWTILNDAASYGDAELANLDKVKLEGPVRTRKSAASKQYNVVVIILESVRAHSIKMYGAEHDTMPFLESLARKGRWVKEGYTVVPHTSKALVSILCGAYPKIVTPIEETGLGAIPPSCIAHLLAEQGYETAFFQPAQEGFERRHALVRNMGFKTFMGKESLPNAKKFHESSYFGYEDDIMLEPSLEWVDAQKGPFFLNYLTLTAHHDYTVPKGFPTEDFVKNEELNKYMNTLRYTDRFVRKVVESFKKRGLLDKTVFVILGDHGEGFREHGRVEHDNVIYEEGLHVPVVLYGAGIPSDGKAIGGLRQHIDVLPTIMQALGLDLLGGQLPGKSLLGEQGHDELFYSCWYTNFCMAHRQGSKKTIYHYHRRKPQLFDLSKDPKEKENLARKEGIDEGIIKKLKSWKRETNLRYDAYLKQRVERFVTKRPPKVPHPTHIVLDKDIALIGYASNTRRVKRGGSMELTLFFQALAKPRVDWSLFVHLKSSKRTINADHVPVSGAYPIGRWKEGEFIEDRHAIHFNRSLPPGDYTVSMGFWNRRVKSEVSARAKPTGTGAHIASDRRVELFKIKVLP